MADEESGDDEAFSLGGQTLVLALHPAYQDFADKDEQWVLQRLLQNQLLQRSSPGPRACFAIKLHEAVEACSASSLSCVVRWLPHGRAFKIYNRQRFVKEVLPYYVQSQGTYSSFQRQLNMYGFLRLTGRHGEKGAYYHQFFLRGRTALSELISRQTEDSRQAVQLCRLDPRSEPDFFRMPHVLDLPIADTDVQPQTEQGSPVGDDNAKHERRADLSLPRLETATSTNSLGATESPQLRPLRWPGSIPGGLAHRVDERVSLVEKIPLLSSGPTDPFTACGEYSHLNGDVRERSSPPWEHDSCHLTAVGCNRNVKPVDLTIPCDRIDVRDSLLGYEKKPTDRALCSFLDGKDFGCSAPAKDKSPQQSKGICGPFSLQLAASQSQRASQRRALVESKPTVPAQRHNLPSSSSDEFHVAQRPQEVLIDNLGIVMPLEDALASCDSDVYRLLF